MYLSSHVFMGFAELIIQEAVLIVEVFMSTKSSTSKRWSHQVQKHAWDA